jgi:hypothetical protein
MGVASFVLLHLHTEDSVDDSEILSHASVLVDGYSLSKVPTASRVIPLLNVSSVARRLPLPHLAAQSELHLAFALAAARKHVQVEEVSAVAFCPCFSYFAISQTRFRCCSEVNIRFCDARGCHPNVATPVD